MDTVGAFLGPILAILLILWFANDISLVLWFAVIPAFLAIGSLMAGVSEPTHESRQHHFRPPIRLSSLKQFSTAYCWVVGIGAVFTLARFSEAFLVLRAQQLGFSATRVPLVMMVMAGFYVLSAYPVGKWSDRISRTTLLSVGLLLLVMADLVLAYAESVTNWSLRMQMTGQVKCKWVVRYDANGWSSGVQFPSSKVALSPISRCSATAT